MNWPAPLDEGKGLGSNCLCLVHITAINPPVVASDKAKLRRDTYW